MRDYTKNMTDEELVKGCVENNPLVQKRLYEKYARKMFGVCLRYTNDKDEAEDVLQNGFIKVFAKLDTFKNTGSLEGWIRRIVVNTALNHYRESKASMFDADIDEVAYMLPGVNNVSETINEKELLKLIQCLPPGFRTVFNLFAIEGYSHKEIAQELNITEGTSKSQFARARAALQKALGKNENEIKDTKSIPNDDTQ
jgi:RNA polymerase sigma-70 factor (ECF subfamily)